MTKLGADSWMPPDQALVDALKHLQIEWWGGYVGGDGLYLNTPWPHDAWQLLERNGIAPLPIYVPRQSLGQDPVLCAEEAMTLVEAAGMTGAVAGDSEHSQLTVMNFEVWWDRFCDHVIGAGWRYVQYAGAGYVPRGAVPWEVQWGNPQMVPPPGVAYQYGPYELDGHALDADNAADDFPLARFAGAPNPPPAGFPAGPPPSATSDDAFVVIAQGAQHA